MNILDLTFSVFLGVLWAKLAFDAIIELKIFILRHMEARRRHQMKALAMKAGDAMAAGNVEAAEAYAEQFNRKAGADLHMIHISTKKNPGPDA